MSTVTWAEVRFLIEHARPQLAGLTDAESRSVKLVAYTLHGCASSADAVFPSLGVVAHRACFSSRHGARAVVRRMEEIGWVTRRPRFGDGVQRSNAYRFDPEGIARCIPPDDARALVARVQSLLPQAASVSEPVGGIPDAPSPGTEGDSGRWGGSAGALGGGSPGAGGGGLRALPEPTHLTNPVNSAAVGNGEVGQAAVNGRELVGSVHRYRVLRVTRLLGIVGVERAGRIAERDGATIERVAWVVGLVHAGSRTVGWACAALADGYEIPAAELERITERERKHQAMLAIVHRMRRPAVAEAMARAASRFAGQDLDPLSAEVVKCAFRGDDIVVVDAHDPRAPQRLCWATLIAITNAAVEMLDEAEASAVTGGEGASA